MRISFLNHSTGSGSHAIEYIMGAKDSHGVTRERIEVLRGNPEEVGKLIDSLSTVHRYTSGVVSWHVDDLPTKDDLENFLQDFEKTAFAGLHYDQFVYTAVLHEEADHSIHLHIIVPRVELKSGKAMNIAPPGWEKTFDPLRDKWNYQMGWARPDDPERAKMVTPPKEIGRSIEWKEGRDPRQQISDWLAVQVSAGLVNTRDDVLDSLKSVGEITRAGKDYISVKPEGAEKAIRLKGSLYGDEFNGEAFRDAARAAGVRPGGRAEPNLEAARAAQDVLAAAVERRAIYNRSRYQGRAPAPGGVQSPGVRSDKERDPQLARAVEGFRSRFLERAEEPGRTADHRAQGTGSTADGRQPGDAQAREVDVGLAAGRRPGDQLGDGGRSDVLELGRDQPGERGASENVDRSTGAIRSDEQEFFQQSTGQKNQPLDIAKNYQPIIVKNYDASHSEKLSDVGSTILHTSGGKNHGDTSTTGRAGAERGSGPVGGSGPAGLPRGRAPDLGLGAIHGAVPGSWPRRPAAGVHQPYIGRHDARGDGKYAAGLSSVQTLSRGGLDAQWPNAHVVLQGAALSDLEPRRAHRADPVRRADRQPGRTAPPGAWQQYLDAKAAAKTAKAGDLAKLRTSHDSGYWVMRKRHNDERSGFFKTADWKGAQAASTARRSLLAARQVRERLDYKALCKQERAQLVLKHPRFANFKEWARGDGRKAQPAIMGPATAEAQATPKDIRAYTAEVAGQCVHYLNAEGSRSFTDTGRQIVVFDSKDPVAVLAALQLASEKWGPAVNITGNKEFKAFCVKVAAENNITLKDPALQKMVLQQREEFMASKALEKSNDRARKSADEIIVRARDAARATSKQVDRVTSEASDAARATGAKVDRVTSDASDVVRRTVVETQWSATKSVDADRAAVEACASAVKAIPRVRQAMDDELERFKKDISIADIAQDQYGYELDKKESSKSYLVLRAGGDKIIVTRDKSDGHDVYFNAHDDSDCGSIIDFVKGRVGDNNAKLVRVRQALRPLAPGSKKPAIKKPGTAPVRPVAVTKDLAKVMRQATDLKPYTGAYLTRERKLDANVIKAFKVVQDARGNACFIHKSDDGISGWESKNAGFTGFAEGGSRALFMAKPGQEPVSRIVVTEAAIDAMSYAQMRHKAGTAYLSTGGSALSAEQQQQLKAVFARNPQAAVVLATDHDAAGEKAAEQIKTLALAGQRVERELPKAKDWNQDLQSMAKAQDVTRLQAARTAAVEQAQVHERGRGMGQ